MKLQGVIDWLSNISAPDGAEGDVILGKMREIIVAELHGKYYTDAYNERLYVGNQAAAGAVLPIYSNTTQQCGLFNPLGSGVNVTPVKINITLVDTTGAAGGFCLGYKTGCGGSIATGSPGITVATLVTPINLNLIASGGSKALFMSAAITTAAPAILMQLGLNQLVLTPATTGAPQYMASIDFDGYPIVSPGTAIFVCGNIATLAKFACSIVWEETPI